MSASVATEEDFIFVVIHESMWGDQSGWIWKGKRSKRNSDCISTCFRPRGHL
jgi:hypothetical protein